MPNRCVAAGCTTGHERKTIKTSSSPNDDKKHISRFSFPINKNEILDKWKDFAGIQKVSVNSDFLCEKHFEERFLDRKKQRTLLRWDQYPIPSIHSIHDEKRSAPFPSELNLSMPSKRRRLDETNIKQFKEIELEIYCPEGYLSKRTDEY